MAPGKTASLAGRSAASRTRSEEHTSELQSLRHLVCRLLLEKKKKPRTRQRFEPVERMLGALPELTGRLCAVGLPRDVVASDGTSWRTASVSAVRAAPQGPRV